MLGGGDEEIEEAPLKIDLAEMVVLMEATGLLRRESVYRDGGEIQEGTPSLSVKGDVMGIYRDWMGIVGGEWVRIRGERGLKTPMHVRNRDVIGREKGGSRGGGGCGDWRLNKDIISWLRYIYVCICVCAYC